MWEHITLSLHLCSFKESFFSFLQLRLQLWEAYCQVRSICSQLRGNDITDSALSTDSSMDESSETLSAKDVPTGSFHASLLELRRLTRNLLDGNESTVTIICTSASFTANIIIIQRVSCVHSGFTAQ